MKKPSVFERQGEPTVFGRSLDSVRRDLAEIVRDSVGSDKVEEKDSSSDLVERLYRALELSGDPVLESLMNKLGGYLASEERCVVTLKIDPIKGSVNITY